MTPAQGRAVARRQCLEAVVVGQTLLSLSHLSGPLLALVECVSHCPRCSWVSWGSASSDVSLDRLPSPLLLPEP